MNCRRFTYEGITESRMALEACDRSSDCSLAGIADGMSLKGAKKIVSSGDFASATEAIDESRPFRVTFGGVNFLASPAFIFAISSSKKRGTSFICAMKLL